ncbi:MAG TPA: trypsin-like peptidase domain-containing protein, partial [Candidatus Saccharimonadales bacterium]|nr:trypsin-like peptidase domain-containing protein [Candidatus Saccharimonadales bacterium]
PTEEPAEEQLTLPYALIRRLIILSLVVGLVGGVAGSYLLVRYLPGSIPVSKQSVVVQESSAAVDVAKKVSPSVVSITSESTGFSFFGSSQTEQGAGTGIIVSSNGLIMTNNHVISGATELDVFTSNGKEYKNAKVVATDATNDLAFIQINASGLQAATLGDSSSVQVGTEVIAIGNALGQYQNTVTQGIISGLGRPVAAGDEGSGSVEQLQNLFQTDAAINPGNSGGPLVDVEGDVIGINTAVASDAQGIGFAIPINEARQELQSVESQGTISRPYLGVYYIPVTQAFASDNNLPVSNGAYITPDQSSGTPAVVSGSPADKAGLKEGDIITKVGSQTIDQNHSLSSLIGNYKVGSSVQLTYIDTNGKTQTVSVTLQQAPND